MASVVKIVSSFLIMPHYGMLLKWSFSPAVATHTHTHAHTESVKSSGKPA